MNVLFPTKSQKKKKKILRAIAVINGLFHPLALHLKACLDVSREIVSIQNKESDRCFSHLIAHGFASAVPLPDDGCCESAVDKMHRTDFTCRKQMQK